MNAPSLDQLLVYAAMAGDMARLEQRLSLGASPLYVDPIRGSALMQACHRGFTAVAARLLESGADPNAVHVKTGISATDIANRRSDRSLVELCLAKGGRFPKRPEPVQVSFERAVSVPMPWPWSFLNLFEIHCVFDCCGWDAYDFDLTGVDAVMMNGEWTLLRMKEEVMKIIVFSHSSSAQNADQQWTPHVLEGLDACMHRLLDSIEKSESRGH